ncbi:MAG TPA: efflux RND transporter periplasmic adaptor subunit [Polyangiaceae bacterium]|nr:efflux RND transporter periplasmic adaptor subunit [Polyangiaceae bacterium]
MKKSTLGTQRRWLLAMALPCALGASACKRSVAEVAEPAAAAAPVSVQTEAVSVLEVPRTLRLTGTLRGDREADLAANATGRVLSVAIERGVQVKPGQVLAKLDVRAATLSASEARAQADSARAQEEQARDECGRYEKLKERGAISDLEYQQKVTQCRTLPLTFQAASARADLAAQNVGDGIIRAPFAGLIAERFVEVGQYVRQDTKVATIVSVDPIRLELAVPEADVARVSEGAVVSFGVSAYPGRRFEGKIRYVSGVVRSSTRDLVVEAVCANPERLLKPGMFADVELNVGSQKLPSVSKGALLARDEQSRLFVVSGGRLEERVVALGPTLGERVSVLRGVSLEDRVVVSDPSQLANGQVVE